MAKDRWFGWGKKKNQEKQDDTLVQPIEENITVEEDADAEQITPENTKVGFFGRLKDGLKKTRDAITHRLDEVVVSVGKLMRNFEELEEILITSDMDEHFTEDNRTQRKG